MKDFNIAKYLKENSLGPHAILGAYVDLHALKEEVDYNNLTPEKLKGLADAGDFTAQRILKKKNDDADQRMKAQDSTPNDDGDCPQGMTPDPVYGCIREREEADYGNNEPVDEVPYVGADKKLDGFGDEFDQVAPVEEAVSAWEEKLNYYESEVNDLVYDMMDTTGADADQIADFFQYISTQVRNHGNY